MDRHRIIETLRSHQGELQAAGVAHLSLFGSIARGDATPHSDIDLMVDFDPSRRLTLVMVGSLQNHLAKILGADVEISSPSWMRDAVRSNAEREAIFAF